MNIFKNYSSQCQEKQDEIIVEAKNNEINAKRKTTKQSNYQYIPQIAGVKLTVLNLLMVNLGIHYHLILENQVCLKIVFVVCWRYLQYTYFTDQWPIIDEYIKDENDELRLLPHKIPPPAPDKGIYSDINDWRTTIIDKTEFPEQCMVQVQFEPTDFNINSTEFRCLIWYHHPENVIDKFIFSTSADGKKHVKVEWSPVLDSCDNFVVVNEYLYDEEQMKLLVGGFSRIPNITKSLTIFFSVDILRMIWEYMDALEMMTKFTNEEDEVLMYEPVVIRRNHIIHERNDLVIECQQTLREKERQFTEHFGGMSKEKQDKLVNEVLISLHELSVKWNQITCV